MRRPGVFTRPRGSYPSHLNREIRLQSCNARLSCTSRTTGGQDRERNIDQSELARQRPACREFISNMPCCLSLVLNAVIFNPQNYVWQHIVQHGSVRHREQLISSLSGSFAKLSSKPFASWCCQKALEHANATQREALIGELLQGGPQVFGDLATHKNGSESLHC